MLLRRSILKFNHRSKLTSSITSSIPNKLLLNRSSSQLSIRPSSSSKLPTTRNMVSVSTPIVPNQSSFIASLPNSKLNAPSPYITTPQPFQNLLAGYELIPATGDIPEHALFKGEIQQSPNDDRLYR
jgi:hypothetical protein